MWKRHIDLPIYSIACGRCPRTMTGQPVLTIWKRDSHILPCQAGTTIIQQMFSTCYPLPMNGKLLAQPICYSSRSVGTSYFSAPCHHRFIIWEKLMSGKCAKVSNPPHSEMHHKIVEFLTLDSYSGQKLERTGEAKLVVWCSDVIWMYSFTVYLLNIRLGCSTTVNQSTAQQLLSVWDLVARYNLPMPTKGLCLNLITSGSNLWKVTYITPSQARFLVFLYSTLSQLRRIRSTNFRSAS